MKKVVISFGLLLTSVVLGIALGLYHNKNNSSGDIDNRVYAQAIMVYDGFDSVLEDADIIVTGTIESINIHDEYDEYIVVINDTKKGNAMEQIAVRNYLYEYAYMDGETEVTGRTNTNYEVGESYIFILQHIRNVYEDMYMILSDVYIPMDNIQRSTVLSENLGNIEDCETYIDQYDFKNVQGKGVELSLDYIESSDEEVILAESKYIAKVEVQELYRSTEVVDVYACKVMELMKGDMTTLADNQIIIPFFKNTVEVGNSYMVCLNSDREDAIIYTLSSKNSVLETNQLESIESIVNR